MGKIHLAGDSLLMPGGRFAIGKSPKRPASISMGTQYAQQATMSPPTNHKGSPACLPTINPQADSTMMATAW